MLNIKFVLIIIIYLTLFCYEKDCSPTPCIDNDPHKNCTESTEMPTSRANLAWLVTPGILGLGLIYLVYKCCRDGLCNWKRLRQSHLPHPSYRPVESISSRTTSRFTAGGRDLMLVTDHRLSLSVYDPSPPPPYSRDETRFAFDHTPIPPEYVERNNSCLPPPFRSRNNTGEENSDKRTRHSSEKCERRNTWSGRRRRHASHDNGVLTSRLRRNTGEMMSGNVNPLALEVTNLDEQENLLPTTIEK